MIHDRLREAFEHTNVSTFVADARSSMLARSISDRDVADLVQHDAVRLVRLAYLYESIGYEQYRRAGGALAGGAAGERLDSARDSFASAYNCWESLSSLPSSGSSEDATVSPTGLEILEQENPHSLVPAALELALHLAVTSTLSESAAAGRLSLERFDLETTSTDAWKARVVYGVSTALSLLVRKQNGWSDIDAGIAQIDGLRADQRNYEGEYLEAQEAGVQESEAMELVGLYHVAQLVTLTGEYLQAGDAAISAIRVTLAKHRDRAETALKSSHADRLLHFSRMVWSGCQELCNNSLWTHVSALGTEAKKLGREIAARGRSNPVIELWPSQQVALRERLLDPYPRAIVVEMPTSAGKTLLAEFSAVQALALNPDTTVAYVVPTRALVNQVTQDLRSSIGLLGRRVEQAVPSFELNPTESKLLTEAPDILVTTAEKLDLLVKSGHPSVASLSLVIADEAHNIADGASRGPRLELLLGTIKRERSDTRFLLLSPFLPNGDEISEWLGGDRPATPIRVNWRPSAKIVGAVMNEGRLSKRALTFTSLPAADNQDVRPDTKIPIAPPTEANSIQKLTLGVVKSLRDKGSVLVLCRGRGTAASRAKEISNELPEVEQTELMGAVRRYVDAEAGRKTDLGQCLKHGVAYHHSGLSQEARWLVEKLTKSKAVGVVCGTTTLAQGINFPIRTVIVETLMKGNATLSYRDFWNIAGRAGRALQDSVGIVAFPTQNRNAIADRREFLEGEATEVASQLATLISDVEEIGDEFNLATVRKWPQMAELMRFLAHAMRTGGEEDLSDQIEDLLRNSLAYHNLERFNQDAAMSLVELSRKYLASISEKGTGLLALSDNTGFATPSVLTMLARQRNYDDLRRPDSWRPDHVFGSDIGPLTERIEIVGDLPEMRLGQDVRGQFNAQRVAEIIRDWVGGVSIGEMSDRHGSASFDDPAKRLSEFSKYLFSTLVSQASWGLGALETVCLGTETQDPEEPAAYVPSMVYFGVNTKEAVWLRMAGVPRLAAQQLGKTWGENREAPQSFEEIRTWVSNLNDRDWQRALPSDSALTPNDMRLVWQELGA